MNKDKIYLFDTTLRDGAQTEGVDFSLEDKNKIAHVLSEIGIDYIEGGWPGANPIDTKFYSKPPKTKKSIFTAFGMTKKTGRSADNDPGLASLINAETPAVCVVGKAWDFHVKVALGIKNDENLFGIEKLNIKRSSIPAITHVDYSARIQTVHKQTNSRYYELIQEFKKITNCPVLVNTSFNVRGEPIVCSVEDAFNCFMGTNLDILVVEDYILFKEQQDKSLISDYKNKFELD